MITAAFITLAIALCAISLAWFDDAQDLSRERERRIKAEDDSKEAEKKRKNAVDHLHAIANSAMRGSSIVRVHVDEMAIHDCFRAIIEGNRYLFTKQELESALKRDAFFSKSHKKNDTPTESGSSVQ